VIPGTASRRSPIQHLLEACGAELRDFGGSCFAVRVESDAAEARALTSLGICDVSGLQKLGVKGPDAAAWLHSVGIDVPAKILGSDPLPEGGVIVRFGRDEFFLEDGITNAALPKLTTKADSHRGDLYRIEHDEATFLLVGDRANKVLAQTCGINFGEVAAQRILFTRVAGVSCGILPESANVSTYRLWFDPSYAVYLWTTLVEICESLDGRVIGAGCLYPELLK
jgi:sarcosine oxidase subunit gamma